MAFMEYPIYPTDYSILARAMVGLFGPFEK